MLRNIFAIPELRQKIYITALFLIVYRIGYYIPLPMIDSVKMAEKMANAAQGPFGQLLGFVSLFSGGNLSQSCIFALGIMPYISASIILQLLASSGLSPALDRIRKEPNGQKKINEYTRYLTVPICIVQSIVWVSQMTAAGTSDSAVVAGMNNFWFSMSAVLTMTVATLFLMWIGEQIDEYGIGNGISLIIMSGIIARIPDALTALLYDPLKGGLKESIFTLGAGTGDISFEKLILLMGLFLFTIIGVIAITKGQRRIPTQSAKHVKGRRVYGGTKQFLPLKVNQAGVMPVIFASSLLIVPMFLSKIIASSTGSQIAGEFAENFQRNSGWVYNTAYIAMIYFFCYFWTAITFNPRDMANNLKDHGSFIPGYRPGRSTADYLEKVLLRITYVGAAFLAIIAIIPNIVNSELGVDYRVAAFFGGTGLLIVVSGCLDLTTKINSHLVMRNYPGLTDD